MSFSEKVMTPSSSPIMSRRLFTRRAVASIAATTGLALAGSAVAQESRLLNEGSATGVTAAENAVDKSTRSGQFIADFALQFVGYPYAWGGNTPAGFDCSGFTQYVTLSTVGYDIGHASQGQMAYGTWVDAGDLQPGDLVFFANTYGPGITHTGVYIGDSQFVHSENSDTGVVISWLWSDYYGGHYAGAMRHW